MDLLLDSHAILWSLYEPEHLSAHVADLLTDKNNKLFVSLGSLMEIAHKAAFHKLPLVGSDIRELLRQLVELDCTMLPILETDILAAAALPLLHGDPFDRLYVAQAKNRGLISVTQDRRLVLYDVETIW